MNARTDARPTMHLIPARGGGSARFARDLLQFDHGDSLLHMAEDTAVVETFGVDAQFCPYRLPDAAASAAWLNALLRTNGGALLHVHFMQRATLELLERWCGQSHFWVLSVHDLGFLAECAFDLEAVEPEPEQDWMRRWHAVMVTAAAITVPSVYLAGVVRRHFPEISVQIVEPGVMPGEPLAEHNRALQTIAVVGALGPHKGKERLLRWLRHPDAGRFRWVLIGYSDEQLHPGKLANGRLWVHGPFLHQQTAHWLQHYQVDLVAFPNRLAESFSYALSDVWSAGVPVLVPDAGALGARVRIHGGGALLADPDHADQVMAALNQLIDGTQLSAWRRQIATQRAHMVPGTDAMRQTVRMIHAQLPADSSMSADIGPALAKLQPYLRSQLDDAVFRHENIRLARDYGQVRAWAEKLESDVGKLEQDLLSLGQVRHELDQALARRELDISRLQDRNRLVESDAAELQQRNRKVEADAAELTQVAQLKIAELHALAGDLNRQLDEQAAQKQLLIGLSNAQAGEIIVMHQRINALVDELRPMRIKSYRYDRVLAWFPNWAKKLVRQARMMLKPAKFRRRSA